VPEYKDYPWGNKDWTSFCINVGGKNPGQEVWYPASRLTIVDWQIVKEKMPDEYSAQMLTQGEKRPQQKKNKIGEVQEFLGLGKGSFYEVSEKRIPLQSSKLI
jgi:hypothetical protein